MNSLRKKFDDIDKRFNGALWQFIRFGVVGISNTAVGYILNIATLLILRPSDYNGIFDAKKDREFAKRQAVRSTM